MSRLEPVAHLLLFVLVQLGIAAWCGRDAARAGQSALVMAAAVLALALVGPAVFVLTLNMAEGALVGWVVWLWLLAAPGILSYLALRPVLAAVDHLAAAVYELELGRRREGE